MAEVDDIAGRVFSERRWAWLRQVVLQVVLLAVAVNIFWDETERVSFSWNRLVAFAGYYGLLAGMVYANILWLVPRFLMRRRHVIYGLFIVASILLTAAGIALLETLLMNPDPSYEHSPQPGWLSMMSSVVGMGLFLLGTSAFALVRRWIIDNRRVDDLREQTLQSELAMLRSQINPHFLFNMLNNAYLLVVKRRPRAVEVLLRLKELLRYQMEEGSGETVELPDEIAFLDDFLQLEKVRRDRFEYTIETHGDISNHRVASMLFIPFVENAVKHGNDADNVSRIWLSFAVERGILRFSCRNTKPLISAVKNDVGGIGLRNIRRRLELLYPATHLLTIDDTQEYYTVTLILPI